MVTSEAAAPRRTSLREEQKALTRNRLMDAALEVFKEQGFDNATVDDIVAGAGASRATFYLHFKNTLELAIALVERSLPDVEAYYSELDRIQDAGDRRALRSWVGRVMAWFAEHETVLLAFERITLSGQEAASAVGTQYTYTSHMPRYLSRWPASRHVEAEARVSLLVALMGRVHVIWRYAHQMPQVDAALMTDILTDYWAKGLCMGEAIPRKQRSNSK